MTQPQQELTDLYRAGLKTAADVFKVSLQNAERLQNQQLVVIKSALDQQARAIDLWSELCQAQMQQAKTWMNEVESAAAPSVRSPVQPPAQASAPTSRRASAASSS